VVVVVKREGGMQNVEYEGSCTLRVEDFDAISVATRLKEGLPARAVPLALHTFFSHQITEWEWEWDIIIMSVSFSIDA
jgi:hypothetical protein